MLYTQLSLLIDLFGKLVLPITERFHRRFCKGDLCASSQTHSAAALEQRGRLPLSSHGILYWIRHNVYICYSDIAKPENSRNR